MGLPEEARRLISQSIVHTAFSISCSVPEGGIIRMTEQIERALEEAGYVLMTREQLGKGYDQFDEADYVDWQ
jgi:hypothetical protein